MSEGLIATTALPATIFGYILSAATWQQARKDE
jgi:hypothetical protein